MRRVLQVSIFAAIVSALARFVAVPAYSAWTAPRPTIVDGEFRFDTFRPQVMHHTFRVRNEGRSPTTVTGVWADCGCTSLERDLVGTTLAAGEEIAIPIAVEVSANDDQLVKSIRLQFSAGSPPQLRLWIKGRVHPFWVTTPTELNLSAEHFTDRVIIRPATGAPIIQPATVITNHPDVDVDLTSIDDSNSWALDVQFAGALTIDRHEALIFVQSEDTSGTVSVPIKLTVP